MCHPAWGRARAEAMLLADLARLRRVRDRITREYARSLDVEALARDAGMPPGQLGRRFRLAYGASPYAWLTARRIERAAALLRRGDLGVAEVRSLVGYRSPGVFGTRFTELVGTPPGAYRRGAAATAAAAAAAGVPPHVAERATGPAGCREASAAEPQPA
ncbi:helix-turn-helix transcriptional regulator [Streptomyces sp. NPDC001380]|uniref:helix-turn-helix transcriptional regulator n=1 Tax=Streptomyces sp. NPDC001380 TaxID=3364566 RepID=UPI003680EF09